jgi:hypothetical protein
MSNDKDDKWEMPQPVFRSTTGGLPKSLEETISQSFSPDKVDVPDEDDDILGVMDLPPKRPAGGPAEQILDADVQTDVSSEEIVDDHPEPVDPDEAAEAEKAADVESEPKRATFWTFTTIFMIIVIAAAVILAIVIYFVRNNTGDLF